MPSWHPNTHTYTHTYTHRPPSYRALLAMHPPRLHLKTYTPTHIHAITLTCNVLSQNAVLFSSRDYTAQEFDLFVSHIIRVQWDRRLHTQQGKHLPAHGWHIEVKVYARWGLSDKEPACLFQHLNAARHRRLSVHSRANTCQHMVCMFGTHAYWWLFRGGCNQLFLSATKHSETQAAPSTAEQTPGSACFEIQVHARWWLSEKGPACFSNKMQWCTDGSVHSRANTCQRMFWNLGTRTLMAFR